jgi:hypothetical protein
MRENGYRIRSAGEIHAPSPLKGRGDFRGVKCITARRNSGGTKLKKLLAILLIPLDPLFHHSNIPNLGPTLRGHSPARVVKEAS